MAGLSILIVEDVDEMRELLKVVLQGTPGVGRITLAADTWQARAEVQRHRPDVVFLDEVLPGESSIDLLIELHSQGMKTVLITEVQAERPLPEQALTRIHKPGWESIEIDQTRFAVILDLLDQEKVEF